MLYAVGDIHGHKEQLDRALDLIARDGGKNATIVFLGDYTDRGPDSRGVIQRLIDGVIEGRNWIVLRGNHDRMFTRFVRSGRIDDPAIKSGKSWLHTALGGPTTLASYSSMPGFLHPQGGGIETLQSYGLDPAPAQALEHLLAETRIAVPDTHVTFLETRPLWYETPGLLFVHAGIRPGVPMSEQTEDDLVWIREPFLSDTRDHGALIVHGHTIQDYPRHFGNRVNLDGGAGAGRTLHPAVWDGHDWFLLKDDGREILRPET